MMMTASQRWRGLARELGSDVEWQMGGHLKARSPTTRSWQGRYERWAADAASLGLDSRVVSRTEVGVDPAGVSEKWAARDLHGLGWAGRPPSPLPRLHDGAAKPAECRSAGAAVQTITLAGGAVAGVTRPWARSGKPCGAGAGVGHTAAASRAGSKSPAAGRQTVVLTEPVPAITQAAAWTGELFVRQDVRGCLPTSPPQPRNELSPQPGFDDVPVLS